MIDIAMKDRVQPFTMKADKGGKYPAVSGAISLGSMLKGGLHPMSGRIADTLSFSTPPMLLSVWNLNCPKA